MCGIVGILDFSSKKIDAALLSSMNDSLSHRGPNDWGCHVENDIGLAHRRLSIIDLAGGKQPIYNENKSVVVVFNGEIYNFRELRTELQQSGHHFATSTDTEVIVHGWEQWGVSCVQHFRGMFAFALWDSRQRTLFLARDRLGIKPLYYCCPREGLLIFASELKAIQLHNEFRPSIDPLAVEEYFAYGYVPDRRTIFQDVKKLPPGNYLQITSDSTRIEPIQYWDVPFAVSPTCASVQSVADELVDRVKEAVRIRLVSDVPLGAFLSGGVDSSVVVAMMAELQPRNTTTCSISFDNTDFNEALYSAEVASRYQTNHHVQLVDREDVDLIGQLARIYDEPFADSSALPTYRLCEMARKLVTVALSGDGGDEVFAGYRDHRVHCNKDRIRRLLPAGFRRVLFGNLGEIYPRLLRAPRYLRARTTFQTLAVDAATSFARGRMITSPDERAALYSSKFRSDLQGYDAADVMVAHAQKAPTDHPLSLAQYLDMKVYLPSDILTKLDRASMAHGLEVRVPLLDHPLVEWISSLPPSLMLRNGVGKYIFKKSFESRLSRRILYRPKMGFSIPLAEWLRGPLRMRLQKCVVDSRLLDTGIFDQKLLQKMFDEHESRRRDHSALLWSLMMFDNFLCAQ